MIFSKTHAYSQTTQIESEVDKYSMKRITHREPGMASPATYQITVRGRLPDHWGAWFYGTTIRIEHGSEGSLHTCLTCQVMDQSELLGILNQLNNLNLPLLQMILLE